MGCGALIRENIMNNNDPFYNMYDVYAQLDGDCYFPQIEALDAIHEYYPNCTFILNVRNNVSTWINSVRTFKPKWRGVLKKYQRRTICIDENNIDIITNADDDKNNKRRQTPSSSVVKYNDDL